MSRFRIAALAAAAVPVVFLLLVVAAWAVDASTGGSQVRRNVTVAGHDVGGLSREDLLGRIGAINADLDGKRVDVRAVEPPRNGGGGSGEPATLVSTAGDLGLGLHPDRTAEAALEVGRDVPVALRPFDWLVSFFRHREADVALTVDDDRLRETLADLDTRVRTQPIEPSIAVRDGQPVVVPGKPGMGLDAAAVSEGLLRIGPLDRSRLAITVTMQADPPQVSDAAAQDLLTTLLAATAEPIPVSIDGEVTTLAGPALRPFLRSTSGGGELQPALEPNGTLELLEQSFAGLGQAPVNASISVAGNRVVVQPSQSGTMCCAPEAVDVLAAALVGGSDEPVVLPVTRREAQRDEAYFDRLGIVEKVSEFTTEHPCCAPRVTNIHRIADIVRGVIIEPGGTFSVNAWVGRRTPERGFVAAPIIDADGNFTDDVGGGISQFATTLFNAAFFAGLEIPEYMAHGLYISRYPYGREATISWGGPDLKIRNNTPHGVLIWPSYTDTSITVALYSTRYIEAGQAGQYEERFGEVCTRVVTTRSRTWLTTGETALDRFTALYAPAEGVQCDGSVVRPPGAPDPTTTTTAPEAAVAQPPTTTVPPPPQPEPGGAGSATAPTATTAAAAPGG